MRSHFAVISRMIEKMKEMMMMMAMMVMMMVLLMMMVMMTMTMMVMMMMMVMMTTTMMMMTTTTTTDDDLVVDDDNVHDDVADETKVSFLSLFQFPQKKCLKSDDSRGPFRCLAPSFCLFFLPAKKTPYSGMKPCPSRSQASVAVLLCSIQKKHSQALADVRLVNLGAVRDCKWR